MTLPRYLQQHDAAILGRLAGAWMRAGGERACAGTRLAELLGTAILLPASDGRGHAGLHAQVRCRSLDSGEQHLVFLACPHDANLALARVSLLTPLGLAVLGRVRGSIVSVEDRAGETGRIEIVAVMPAAGHAPAPPRAHHA